MDRPLNWGQSQVRSFDLVYGYHDAMVALAQTMEDVLGQPGPVVSGLVATPTGPASLSVNLTAGRIYQLAAADATADGAIPQDTTQILQQGFSAAQLVTFSTAGIGAGQSRYSLLECQFSQVDVIRPTDPTGGLLFFYNAANPTQPYEGPGNDGLTTPTVRQGLCILQVITGAAATTGAEVPPTPTSGWTPLYLVDLAFGQTTVTSGEILVAGPSVGVGVPSNYPYAPFLAGLLNQHHKGTGGQAPQIDLTSEVKNILPLANIPASSATPGTGVPVLKLFGGNPNSHVAGNANVNGSSDMCFDTADSFLYICTTTGSASTAVWTNLSSGGTVNFNGGTSGGTANAQTIASTTPAGFSLTTGYSVTFLAGNTNTGATTLNVDGTGVIAINKISGVSLVPLTGGEIVSGAIAVVTYTGTVWELQASGLGTAAYQNVSFFLQTANLLSEIPAASGVGTAQGNLEMLSLTSTGASNAYVLTYSPAPPALVAGQLYSFISNFTNTSAATLNVNGTGAKAIVKNGLNPLVAGDIVTGQIVDLRYDGTQFQMVSILGTARVKLGASTSFFVSTAGSDTTGTGTIGNPWATRQHAYNFIQQNIDLNGFVATVQLVDGTYTDSFTANGPVVGQSGPNAIVFNGNAITPTNVVVNPSGAAFGAFYGGSFEYQNMQVQSSGSNAVNIGEGCQCLQGPGVVFGTTSGDHINVGGHSLLQIANNYTVAGNATRHWDVGSFGCIIAQGIAVTITGTPNFSQAFALAQGISELNLGSTTFSGAATGVRFVVNTNSVIATGTGNLAYLPGNASGSQSTGGVYT